MPRAYTLSEAARAARAKGAAVTAAKTKKPPRTTASVDSALLARARAAFGSVDAALTAALEK